MNQQDLANDEFVVEAYLRIEPLLRPNLAGRSILAIDYLPNRLVI